MSWLLPLALTVVTGAVAEGDCVVAAPVGERDISYCRLAGGARRAATRVVDAHTDFVLALVRIGVRTVNSKAAPALCDDGAG